MLNEDFDLKELDVRAIEREAREAMIREDMRAMTPDTFTTIAKVLPPLLLSTTVRNPNNLRGDPPVPADGSLFFYNLEFKKPSSDFKAELIS